MRAGAAACAAGLQGMAAGGTAFCKKWVRTRRAIVLRMSNRTVQVSFYDGAHLQLAADGHSAAFVDASGRRLAVSTQAALLAAAAPAGAVAGGDLAEVARRIAYAKSVLQQMVNPAPAPAPAPADAAAAAATPTSTRA